ncbi:hypothetical protein [Glutamicibacter halophytocola]|uniref:Uncharacterized protein n=1 Tax=Glutamicibacter halophytocola TaxID=1933880 RepID=A0AA94XT14_9MICC|nr:hypothetical protein [Glutamicibacter halophytocola]UUX59340.1 hypothetical protein NUH22_01485 [Glutamicibacter halophytocola]
MAANSENSELAAIGVFAQLIACRKRLVELFSGCFGFVEAWHPVVRYAFSDRR